MMKGSKTDLSTMIEGFRFCCETEGKSPRTVEWYLSFLRDFHRFLEDQGLSTDATAIGRAEIRMFISFLQTKSVRRGRRSRTRSQKASLAPATIQGYVRTLKAFFSWILREEYVESNPTAKIRVPNAPSKVIEAFTESQMRGFLQAFNQSTELGARNFAIAVLLLDTGIRVSELVSLTVADVRLEEGQMKIRHGKGGRERIVPIGSEARRALWRYINNTRPHAPHSEIQELFLGSNGLPLTKSGVQQMIRRHGRMTGIDGVRCSPHTFRHTFAKRFLLNGGDVFTLQHILGHSSLEMVRRYVNLVSGDVQAQHRRFSPVDTLRLRAPSRSLTEGKASEPTASYR